MVARMNVRQRAWIMVDEAHGDDLMELKAMAQNVGPDEAFNIFLDALVSIDKKEELVEAIRPLFQSALLVAAETTQRRMEREELAKRRKP